jgi:hypothetical protein
MSRNVIALSLATIILAGGFGLAMVGAADAEAVTSKCAVEWKAAKANGTTAGKTWKEFFDQCSVDQMGVGRSITLSTTESQPAAPAAAAAPATSAAATPAAAPAPVAAVTDPSPTATAVPVPVRRPKSTEEARASAQFATEAEAKAKCPSDEVVWVNTATKKIHFAGHDGYGKTKKGGYMCLADATAAGARASKGEKQL